MFGAAQRKASTKRLKLHSIAAVLRDRGFEGSFEVAGSSFGFSYRPASAVLRGGKLQLTGRLTVARSGAGTRRSLAGVRATLASTQGGIGTPPPRSRPPRDVGAASPGLPIVESTGSLSFCGALYFKLAPLDARVLGVPADMTDVQLNARLAPGNAVERNLQAAYSSIADALYAKEDGYAQQALNDLNQLLAAR
jgi:hypothetical protein